MADSSTQDKQEGDCCQPTSTLMAPKFRHDWYQTDTFVVLSVLSRGLNTKEVKVTIEEDEVLLSIPQEDASEHSLQFRLSNLIVPDQSSYKIFSTKVEIKLKKRDSLRWAALEGETPKLKIATLPDTPSSTQGANSQSKNWDKVVKELSKDEEKQEGDAALNALFQQIYGDGSDEVKKAMNKSFVESGGTVLSTNWKDVQRDKVDVKPPDGLEWRQWEQ